MAGVEPGLLETNEDSLRRFSSSEQTLGTVKVTDYHLGHRAAGDQARSHAHTAPNFMEEPWKMSEQPQPQRMQQTMPEDDGGWHRVNAGPYLHIMFNPNRLGRQPDEIERPSIVVAVAGKREQALRFDPFSVGSHYHIRPSRRGRQIPLWVEEGQTPLDVALAFFEKPLRFRGLLAQADEDDVASQLDDADLVSAARQIRHLYAAARNMTAA